MNWFRNGIEYYNYINEDEGNAISYQIIGMRTLYAMAIYLSNVKLDRVRSLIIIGISFVLILVSGARQAILGMVLVVFARFFFSYNSRGLIRHFVLGAFITACLAYIVLLLGADLIDSLIETGGNGRSVVMLLAINFFISNPVFGIGFGSFADKVDIESINYPHNFFLEILCEMGIVGLSLISIVVFLFFRKAHVRLKCLTMSNSFVFLIMIALLSKYMVSADLGESIELFSCFL